MTTNQSLAVWELCRQGLPLIADEAEASWNLGQTFQIQSPVALARSIRELLDRCNWEASQRRQAA